jgi:hypothetical protein
MDQEADILEKYGLTVSDRNGGGVRSLLWCPHRLVVQNLVVQNRVVEMIHHVI